MSPLEQAYIKQLEENPLRTKMLTAGTLSGAQEFIASYLAKDRNANGHYFTSRVPKMAAYGAFVSAPLGSLLIYLLQKVFKGRTSLRAKILQILVSNLIVSLFLLFLLLSNLLRTRSEKLIVATDCAHPKLGVSHCHGHHRRCQDIPPGAGNCSCGLLEGDESQLDHLSRVPGFRAEVPA